MDEVTVSFSDLSKHSKRVADTVERNQRVHITRRDGEDLFLATARYDRDREETADVTARLLAALIANAGTQDAALQALLEVFPWSRHLTERGRREFVTELVDALRDAAGLGVHTRLHRVIVEWRATARIFADPELAAQLMRPLPGDDFGEVTAP